MSVTCELVMCIDLYSGIVIILRSFRDVIRDLRYFARIAAYELHEILSCSPQLTRVWRLAKSPRCRHICVCLSLSRNYFDSYAHARQLNIQSHTANCPSRLVTLAHNRSSSHLRPHLPRDTSTYGHQQYSGRFFNLLLDSVSTNRNRVFHLNCRNQRNKILKNQPFYLNNILKSLKLWGGHGHGHHPPYTIPDYRIYKVSDVPELVVVQKALAASGLKDPWLRN
ncbi:hypothetical protein NQ318_000895 [Aromia moschata]|uniref:Uncharacterized protein n=1 Tax=Aromia moschata TaxID=1265417 RepID=A0AAV8ZDZ2_9CUCU|nr:hypothetical protein NQ318_000895 [Aromia moschata]